MGSDSSSFEKLGVRQIESPGSYHAYTVLDFPVSLGEYAFPSKPDGSVHASHSLQTRIANA
jgi:hypothetical protein